MHVHGKHYRTIWLQHEATPNVYIIDQRWLPHRFVTEALYTASDAATAIKDMLVRGAGLIGATAAFGMYLAAREAATHSSFDTFIQDAAAMLCATRPTAVNLQWAVNRQLQAMATVDAIDEKIQLALHTAQQIANEDAAFCQSIGLHGLPLIQALSTAKQGQTVNILTHCNAGWLAFVDYGSATAPIYAAFDKGINLHVWVDETRPRNQGASLTAWELLNHGVPHTVITDNTGGHLMQHGMVDMVITGADRVTRAGDAANKIGTYLKALAAKDNAIPFYVALPSSTFDWGIRNGLTEIAIEQRNADEVKYVQGLCGNSIEQVLITPPGSPAANYGFDVTPARLITGLITERGICAATEDAILQLFPEHKQAQ